MVHDTINTVQQLNVACFLVLLTVLKLDVAVRMWTVVRSFWSFCFVSECKWFELMSPNKTEWTNSSPVRKKTLSNMLSVNIFVDRAAMNLITWIYKHKNAGIFSSFNHFMAFLFIRLKPILFLKFTHSNQGCKSVQLQHEILYLM